MHFLNNFSPYQAIRCMESISRANKIGDFLRPLTDIPFMLSYDLQQLRVRVKIGYLILMIKSIKIKIRDLIINFRTLLILLEAQNSSID